MKNGRAYFFVNFCHSCMLYELFNSELLATWSMLFLFTLSAILFVIEGGKVTANYRFYADFAQKGLRT